MAELKPMVIIPKPDNDKSEIPVEIYTLIMCKDCRYWLPLNRFDSDYHPGRGECELNSWIRDADWFCGDAEPNKEV